MINRSLTAGVTISLPLFLSLFLFLSLPSLSQPLSSLFLFTFLLYMSPFLYLFPSSLLFSFLSFLSLSPSLSFSNYHSLSFCKKVHVPNLLTFPKASKHEKVSQYTLSFSNPIDALFTTPNLHKLT